MKKQTKDGESESLICWNAASDSLEISHNSGKCIVCHPGMHGY